MDVGRKILGVLGGDSRFFCACAGDNHGLWVLLALEFVIHRLHVCSAVLWIVVLSLYWLRVRRDGGTLKFP